MKTTIQLIFALLLSNTNSFAQMQNNGNLRMHNGATMRLLGNFTNHGSFNNNLGTVHLIGGNAQTFDGNNPIQVLDLVLNKSINVLQLDNELQIFGNLSFSNGKIESDTVDMATEFVHFIAGSSYSNASNASHIDGVIRKTGNDAFVFPTGDNNYLRTISISAPSSPTDHFTAYYTETDPNLDYNNTLGNDLDHISRCEYWVLNRTAGNSAVEVTLSWASNSCGVDTLCDLRVARWNGTNWTSEGNGGTAGSRITGTVVSGSNCNIPASVTNFSPFTLASTSDYNMLPIELLFFEAQRCDDEVCIAWETETEINNDYFTVERSSDAIHFEEVTKVTGAGNSSYPIHYVIVDDTPLQGISYYRLQQTDLDGKESFSDIRAVEFDGLNSEEVLVFPNPTSGFITIKGNPQELENYKIFSMLGLDITNIVKVVNQGSFIVELDFSALPAGVYTLMTETSSHKIRKQD
jgi:hypothetical protein